MKKETFEEVMSSLDFSWGGVGDYQIELYGNVSTLVVDLSFNYQFIEGNEIKLDNLDTKNLYNADRYLHLLESDIELYKSKFSQLKAIIEKRR
jgi:hypothetical protein